MWLAPDCNTGALGFLPPLCCRRLRPPGLCTPIQSQSAQSDKGKFTLKRGLPWKIWTLLGSTSFMDA